MRDSSSIYVSHSFSLYAVQFFPPNEIDAERSGICVQIEAHTYNVDAPYALDGKMGKILLFVCERIWANGERKKRLLN